MGLCAQKVLLNCQRRMQHISEEISAQVIQVDAEHSVWRWWPCGLHRVTLSASHFRPPDWFLKASERWLTDQQPLQTWVPGGVFLAWANKSRLSVGSGIWQGDAGICKKLLQLQEWSGNLPEEPKSDLSLPEFLLYTNQKLIQQLMVACTLLCLPCN